MKTLKWLKLQAKVPTHVARIGCVGWEFVITYDKQEKEYIAKIHYGNTDHESFISENDFDSLTEAKDYCSAWFNDIVDNLIHY